MPGGRVLDCIGGDEISLSAVNERGLPKAVAIERRRGALRPMPRADGLSAICFWS